LTSETYKDKLSLTQDPIKHTPNTIKFNMAIILQKHKSCSGSYDLQSDTFTFTRKERNKIKQRVTIAAKLSTPDI